MHKLKQVLLGTGAFASLALGGAGIAAATGNNGDGDGEKADDGPDRALTGPAATNAGAAATKALGGGRVLSVENTDEGGAAFYEVKVDRAGKVIEVQLAENGKVLSTKADDDQGEHEDQGDGDGETGD
ncbi:MAG: hypothetical protein JWO90_404 [Solirubrobacterales bacterium]|jgi:uncharacterized membrane protein YkoI|nr:hypothetical protein [Solirubrobacterales bacterium]